MSEEKNKTLEIGKTTVAIFSLKTKLILVGVIIAVFLFVIVPVVAITSVISNEKQSSKKENSSSIITANEVISVGNLKQYIGADFPMPFETWDTNKDVITSKFSKRRTITINGVTKTSPHTGIDLVVISISNPRICSVLEGKVVIAKSGNSGYGNYVVIQHTSTENGMIFYTLYGHMKEGSIMVAEGTDVVTGQVLGIMGNTGNSTGNHLHFEVRIGQNNSANAVDPYTYLFGK